MRLAAVCITAIASVSAAHAQSPEAFYKGKTIDMMIGSEAGSGYDAYARLVANHMGKHILGRPNIVVKQMVGAGGIVATNYLAKIANKDGSVIGQVQNTCLSSLW